MTTASLELTPEGAAANAAGPVCLLEQMQFEALPEEVQQLARRVLGAEGMAHLDVIDAYEMGWEDAVEDMEISRPTCPSRAGIARRLRPEKKS